MTRIIITKPIIIDLNNKKAITLLDIPIKQINSFYIEKITFPKSIIVSDNYENLFRISPDDISSSLIVKIFPQHIDDLASKENDHEASIQVITTSKKKIFKKNNSNIYQIKFTFRFIPKNISLNIKGTQIISKIDKTVLKNESSQFKVFILNSFLQIKRILLHIQKID